MLVEDNREYRNVLEITLRRAKGIDLVGSSGTAERALDLLKDQQEQHKVDVLLLDLQLPGISGLDAIPHFRQLIPDLKIIVLTQSDKEADVLTAIKRGANGYLLKSTSVDEISENIEFVVNGGASIAPMVAHYVLKMIQQPSPHAATPDEITSLTEREIEVLKLIGEGYVKKEIAKSLDLSYFTVAAHIRNIYEKLGVLNAPAAIAEAYKSGVL